MRASQGELVQPGFTGSVWQNKGVRIALQALLIVVFSAATAIAKRVSSVDWCTQQQRSFLAVNDGFGSLHNELEWGWHPCRHRHRPLGDTDRTGTIIWTESCFFRNCRIFT